MNTETPPARFSFAAFRRYEDTIAHILAAWPTPYKIFKTSLSLTTVESRLRDAITGFLSYAHPSTKVNRTQFQEIARDLIISNRGDYVIAGPRHILKQPTKASISGLKVATKFLDAKGDENITRSIATLFSHRLLTEKTRILNPARISFEEYDVVATQNEDGSVDIL